MSHALSPQKNTHEKYIQYTKSLLQYWAGIAYFKSNMVVVVTKEIDLMCLLWKGVSEKCDSGSDGDIL